jgi:hypothetical protein
MKIRDTIASRLRNWNNTPTFNPDTVSPMAACSVRRCLLQEILWRMCVILGADSEHFLNVIGGKFL